MERVLLAVGIGLAVILVAWLVQRRRPDAPSQGRHAAPDQVDRADFVRPGAPWLLAVFTSANCDSCVETIARAAAMGSSDVAVQEVEVATRPDLHHRYHVDVVPTLVVADRRGVVRASFVGAPGAEELERALAEVTEAARGEAR